MTNRVEHLESTREGARSNSRRLRPASRVGEVLININSSSWRPPGFESADCETLHHGRSRVTEREALPGLSNVADHPSRSPADGVSGSRTTGRDPGTQLSRPRPFTPHHLTPSCQKSVRRKPAPAAAGPPSWPALSRLIMSGCLLFLVVVKSAAALPSEKLTGLDGDLESKPAGLDLGKTGAGLDLEGQATLELVKTRFATVSDITTDRARSTTATPPHSSPVAEPVSSSVPPVKAEARDLPVITPALFGGFGQKIRQDGHLQYRKAYQIEHPPAPASIRKRNFSASITATTSEASLANLAKNEFSVDIELSQNSSLDKADRGKGLEEVEQDEEEEEVEEAKAEVFGDLSRGQPKIRYMHQPQAASTGTTSTVKSTTSPESSEESVEDKMADMNDWERSRISIKQRPSSSSASGGQDGSRKGSKSEAKAMPSYLLGRRTGGGGTGSNGGSTGANKEETQPRGRVRLNSSILGLYQKQRNNRNRDEHERSERTSSKPTTNSRIRSFKIRRNSTSNAERKLNKFTSTTTLTASSVRESTTSITTTATTSTAPTTTVSASTSTSTTTMSTTASSTTMSSTTKRLSTTTTTEYVTTLRGLPKEYMEIVRTTTDASTTQTTTKVSNKEDDIKEHVSLMMSPEKLFSSSTLRTTTSNSPSLLSVTNREALTTLKNAPKSTTQRIIDASEEPAGSLELDLPITESETAKREIGKNSGGKNSVETRNKPTEVPVNELSSTTGGKSDPNVVDESTVEKSKATTTQSTTTTLSTTTSSTTTTSKPDFPRPRAELRKDLLEAIKRKITKNKATDPQNVRESGINSNPVTSSLKANFNQGSPPLFKPVGGRYGSGYPAKTDEEASVPRPPPGTPRVRIFLDLPPPKPGGVVKIPNVSHIQDKLARLNAAIAEGLKEQRIAEQEQELERKRKEQEEQEQKRLLEEQEKARRQQEEEEARRLREQADRKRQESERLARAEVEERQRVQEATIGDSFEREVEQEVRDIIKELIVHTDNVSEKAPEVEKEVVSTSYSSSSSSLFIPRHKLTDSESDGAPVEGSGRLTPTIWEQQQRKIFENLPKDAIPVPNSRTKQIYIPLAPPPVPTLTSPTTSTSTLTVSTTTTTRQPTTTTTSEKPATKPEMDASSEDFADFYPMPKSSLNPMDDRRTYIIKEENERRSKLPGLVLSDRQLVASTEVDSSAPMLNAAGQPKTFTEDRLNSTGSVNKEDPVEEITGTTIYVVGVLAVIPIAACFAWGARVAIKRKDLSNSESNSETGLNRPITEEDSLQIQGRQGFPSLPPPPIPHAHLDAINETSSDNINKNELMPEIGGDWEFPRSKLRLQTVLGEGNFGKVWKAEADDICGYDGTILVAVKTVKENATSQDVEDLLLEMNIMKEIGPHPNVVTLLGVCTEQEPFLLIMEYVMYGKLLTHLREQRLRQASIFNFSTQEDSDIDHSLTAKDLTKFAYGVAKGMEFLVSKGIIHRDLAARNILVDHNKNCKISDFGLSRNLRDLGGEMYEQKNKGALPIRWMAPESLYFSVFTPKSDVWAFGILMWEIVTLGATPYPGMGAREVMRRVRDGYRLERPAHCHPEIYAIIQRCWAGDMNKRPDFAQLRKELAKLLENQHGYIDLQNISDIKYYSIEQSQGEEEKL